jgi:hypothetical protein
MKSKVGVRGGVEAGAAAVALLAAMVGCSGSGSGGGGSAIVPRTTPDGGSESGPASPWVELADPSIVVQGGSAPSTGGVGTNGATVTMTASGAITFDPGQPAVAALAVPAPPAGATVVAADALAADVTVNGSVVVSANVVASGGGARTITANGGDIFVTATLRAPGQGIALHATGGSVIVTGTVDTSGSAGSSQAGGAIDIQARQVTVTGQLSTAGAAGATTGGNGGAVTITSAGPVTVTGGIDTFGGDALDGATVAGGTAGGLSIKAGGDVGIAALVRLRGGAASSSGGAAQGGDAGPLSIDVDGALTLGGVIDARGGLATATSSGGSVTAGKAAPLALGATAPPTNITILVPFVMTGGHGDAVGGDGGTITFAPGTGMLTVAGPRALDASGGTSLTKGGTGGTIQGTPTRDPGTGGVHVTGAIAANGGSIASGGSGNGGDAGSIQFMFKATDGPLTVDQSGRITVDGGNSGGTGTAGGGGHLWAWTLDGDITIAGFLSTSGGSAPDPGGTGGGGGMVYLFSDNNHNGVQDPKGDLLITPTGIIESSGGDGTTGGNARSDGVPFAWPVFPEHQEQIAIFLNCDGQHGETHNWMQNQGHLIARGGAHNGNGGDIVFHGIGPGQLGTPAPPSGNHHPPSGNVDMAADGSGINGDYGGE